MAFYLQEITRDLGKNTGYSEDCDVAQLRHYPHYIQPITYIHVYNFGNLDKFSMTQVLIAPKNSVPLLEYNIMYLT